jgi:hypothetical protein
MVQWPWVNCGSTAGRFLARAIPLIAPAQKS